jgi:hypothetical protein
MRDIRQTITNLIENSPAMKLNISDVQKAIDSLLEQKKQVFIKSQLENWTVLELNSAASVLDSIKKIMNQKVK